MATFEEKDDKLYIDGKEVIKGWESFGGWFWFATEVAQEMPQGKLYFGLVQGFEEEWGYFSEAELKSLGPKVWEIPKHALVWSGRRNPTVQAEPNSAGESTRLCDCEHCGCPKLPGTGEAIPAVCVSCGWEHR